MNYGIRDAFVLDGRYTERIFGRGYVAYEVLANPVRDGWRLAAGPMK